MPSEKEVLLQEYLQQLKGAIHARDLIGLQDVINKIKNDGLVGQLMTPKLLDYAIIIHSRADITGAINTNNEIIKLIIKYCYEINNYDVNGKIENEGSELEDTRTILDSAIHYPNLITLEALLRHHPSKETKSKALLAAVIAGRYDKALFLLEHGADINVTDKDGNNILIIATKRLELDESKLKQQKKIDLKLAFIEKITGPNYGFNPNKADSRGKTALMYANKGPEKIIEMLIAKGANKDCTDNKGNTALMHYSNLQARKGYYFINNNNIKLLIHLNADVNIQNKKEITALRYAIKSSNIIAIFAMLPLSNEKNLKLSLAYLAKKPKILSKLKLAFNNAKNPFESLLLLPRPVEVSFFLTSEVVKDFFKTISTEKITFDNILVKLQNYKIKLAKFFSKQFCLIAGYIRQEDNTFPDNLSNMISLFVLGYVDSKELKSIIDHKPAILESENNNDTGISKLSLLGNN